MRIAIFSEVYWPMVSGVSMVLQRLVGALEQRGHVVRVYAPGYTLPGAASDLRHVFRVPSRQLFIYPDVQWGFPSWPVIRADFAAFRPDLVHVATEFAMGTTGLRLAREFGVPVIASAHTDYERYASRYRVEWLMQAGWHYLRWFYGQGRAVLCPSRHYEQHLQLRGIRHTAVWSRGADLVTFGPAHRSPALREALGIAPDQPMVLQVGRLAAEKNLHVLLDAWEAIAPRRGDARLVLVGGGPLAQELQHAAPEGVILAGVRNGLELSQFYASADLFVFPSSTETFGNVLLEAMASGLPSLAVRAGGVLDFAEHGRNAWLVRPDDPDAFASGMLHLLTNAALRQQLAAGAEATARTRDWDTIFDRVVTEYQRALVAGAVGLAA